MKMAEKNKIETGFSSDAKKDPRRIVFVTRKTSAKVTGDPGPQVMAYPHLMLREAIALQVLVVALVGIALMWDAPLEQLANPLLTPNPAKAPLYFLGLQELLHYFPPFVAGIVIPTLVVGALIVIPYFNVNVQGEPLWGKDRSRRLRLFVGVLVGLAAFLAWFEAWTVLVPTVVIGGLALYAYGLQAGIPAPLDSLRLRPVSWWVMTWFIFVAVVLTVVGTFFRGPGWSWVLPWGSHGG
jgi:menaquinol-cytochrome c reductase cytochrome b/c subunit